MKVYFVEYGTDDPYESPKVAPTVFDSIEDAEAYIAQQKALPDFDADGDWFEVVERERKGK